jgi:beta-galactosidase
MRFRYLYTLCLTLFTAGFASAQSVRKTASFNNNWKFFLGDDTAANTGEI